MSTGITIAVMLGLALLVVGTRTAKAKAAREEYTKRQEAQRRPRCPACGVKAKKLTWGENPTYATHCRKCGRERALL